MHWTLRVLLSASPRHTLQHSTLTTTPHTPSQRLLLEHCVRHAAPVASALWLSSAHALT